MPSEMMNEPIEVLAYMFGSKVLPVKFKRAGKVYDIQQVNRSWATPAGKFKRYYYSVYADGNVYFIYCNQETLSWTLEKVQLD